jgi:acyl-ACP thioesterase
MGNEIASPNPVKIKQDSNIFKDEYSIRSYEVDVKGNVTIQILCQFMQETASKHARALGLGLDHLFAENLTWVLSRLLVRIDTFPKWGATIRVHTWPTGVDHLFALRDFLITDKDDLIIGRATSAWLVIDLIKRRPQRVNPFVDRIHSLKDKRVLKAKLGKLPSMEYPDYIKVLSVRFSDLDMNSHVNSIEYIEWLLESIPFELRKTYNPVELEINFLSEAMYGDEISNRSKKDDSPAPSFLHSLVRKVDGQELCRARTVWLTDNKSDYSKR